MEDGIWSETETGTPQGAVVAQRFGERQHKKRIPFMAGSGGLGAFFARKGNLGKFEMQNEHV
jgi:hypothetical protein